MYRGILYAWKLQVPGPFSNLGSMSVQPKAPRFLLGRGVVRGSFDFESALQLWLISFDSMWNHTPNTSGRHMYHGLAQAQGIKCRV